MRTSFYRTHPTIALPGTLCLALAIFLAGCASRNPLIDDEPAPSASTAMEQPERKAEAKPAQAPGAKQESTVASGVTITEPTGVQRFLGIFSPYRVPVQQGNFISREMVAQLKEGMRRPEGVTREQVRFVLGTPLLTDIFHADRWDYVFRLKKRSGEVISSRVTAYFDGDRLARVEGDTLPTEQEYLALIAGAAPGAKPSDADK